MTDKQIIIDDCIHLNKWKHCDICEKLIKTKDGANGKKREHLLTVGDLKCDFYPNCYYKQLKRKEGIINILEQECTEKMEIIIALENKLTAKEQECEELKKQYNCYACGTCNGKEDFRNLERHHIGLRKSFDELHKQLDQLKAKEQECEKLSFDNFDLKDQLTDLKFKYKTINEVAKSFEQKLQTERKECEELKKIINEAKNSKLDLKSFLVGEAVQNEYEQQLDQLKKQNDIMLNSLKKLQNKLCSSTSQCKYFLIDVLKEVENASK